MSRLLLFILAALPAAAEAPKTAARNVALVHGAWADGSSWAKVIPLLEAEGLHVVAVQNPLTSLQDDVAAVQRAIALQDDRCFSWGTPTAARSSPRPGPTAKSPDSSTWLPSRRTRARRSRNLGRWLMLQQGEQNET